MNNTTTNWVLGHKITLHDTSGDYDLAFGETPAGVQGPPPHFHNTYTESFLITEGEMEFFIDGKVTVVKAGESVNLPKNVLHTFNNKSNSKCKWVNIHSPKGFRRFFETLGVAQDVENSQEKSISEFIIREVIGTAADYDMQIKL
jgi:mannose-6-phosphate isomerase-like protein (cupin superfamily)